MQTVHQLPELNLYKRFDAHQMCDESRAGNLIMCPECDGSCSYWRLRDSCSIARLASVFDNWATVFFACFMSVWACVFLEFWKRKQAELQHDWNVSSFSQHECSRPDFLVRCSSLSCPSFNVSGAHSRSVHVVFKHDIYNCNGTATFLVR